VTHDIRAAANLADGVRSTGGLVEICISPLLAGLSAFLTIGGSRLAHELSSFLGVFVRHCPPRRGVVTGFQVP
jgi:hypothetical protein